MRRTIIAVAVAGVLWGSAPTAWAQPEMPIENVIVVMQEDRTFDHYFGTYPGVNGWPDGYRIPFDPQDPTAGFVEPHKLSETRTISLPHSAAAMAGAYNDGRMDGFVKSARAFGGGDGSLTLGYYDGNDIPFYWYLADEYVLADAWFSSVMGPSFPNHMFLYAGTTRGPDGEPYGSVPAEGLDVETIFDRLQDAGVSWKVYVQGYDPTANFRDSEARLGLTDKGAQLTWVPLVGIPRFVDDPNLSSKIVDIREYYTDAKKGELPAVSFVTPSGLSEHPPGDLVLGHYFATDLIEALMLSPQWDTSAFILTWDEWGGWADHVAPPQVDEDGYGMRVPALIVSPYAKRGYVDSTIYDHTSPLALIERLWNIDPLTDRDAAANDLLNAFDFSQEPRVPELPPIVYRPPTAPPPSEDAGPVQTVYATVFGGIALLAVVSALSASYVLPRLSLVFGRATPPNVTSLRPRRSRQRLRFRSPAGKRRQPLRADDRGSAQLLGMSAEAVERPFDRAGADDLTRIPGIDAPLARYLNQRGVTTWLRLAELSTSERDRIGHVLEPHVRINWDQCQQAALELHLTRGQEVDTVPADDLQAIFGIGRSLERRLNQLGILTYRQLANLTDHRINRLRQEVRFVSRAQWERWRESAERLVTSSDQPAPAAESVVIPRDDLTLILGIGRRRAEIMRAYGIDSFHQLASIPDELIDELSRYPAFARADWKAWRASAAFEHDRRHRG